ncbi:TPA: hypothetical protein N2C05_004787 [Pseudomonas aeruginosa]|nr:hypothetical protein [Pseudomonas aeruginosa]
MSKELNKAPVEQAGGDERDFQAKGAQEVPSPVSKEYDRHLISLLRKGEALPGHQEEAADEIERLRDWNDHLNNTVLPNILNPNFLMLMKGGERLLDLCTKDGEFIGVSLNDMKDVFDWMVTHARIAPDQAALAQPSPVSEALIYACKNLAQITSSDGSGHADIAMAVLRMAGVGDDERERLVNEWKAARAWKPAPAQAEKAEAERPEVEEVSEFERDDIARSAFETAMADGISLDSFLSLSNTLAARYERIVGALRAKLQAAEGRADTLEHRMMGMMTRHFAEAWRNRDAQKALDGYLSAGIAQLEQERDAALAEVKRNKLTIAAMNEAHAKLAADLEAVQARVAELDKQCRDDVARALGLRPNEERGFAWSYLLASIKACVKASENTAKAQHSVPEGFREKFKQCMELAFAEIAYYVSPEKARDPNSRARKAGALATELHAMLAAAPGKEGL